ncbi:unnamed protein product [Cuscuta europaea]|uniref:Uncharacterized protein n=1 Tax=Cuscuta europaea TaxID=41803 RepID=A0A9P1A0Q6_CUSEU|nr:unnamed protein product [Cuscuta europaea]
MDFEAAAAADVYPLETAAAFTDLEVTAIDNFLGVATADKEAAGNISQAQIEIEVREVGMEAAAPEVAIIARETAAGMEDALEPAAASNQNGNKNNKKGRSKRIKGESDEKYKRRLERLIGMKVK